MQNSPENFRLGVIANNGAGYAASGSQLITKSLGGITDNLNTLLQRKQKEREMDATNAYRNEQLGIQQQQADATVDHYNTVDTIAQNKDTMEQFKFSQNEADHNAVVDFMGKQPQPNNLNDVNKQMSALAKTVGPDVAYNAYKGYMDMFKTNSAIKRNDSLSDASKVTLVNPKTGEQKFVSKGEAIPENFVDASTIKSSGSKPKPTIMYDKTSGSAYILKPGESPKPNSVSENVYKAMIANKAKTAKGKGKVVQKVGSSYLLGDDVRTKISDRFGSSDVEDFESSLNTGLMAFPESMRKKLGEDIAGKALASSTHWYADNNPKKPFNIQYTNPNGEVRTVNFWDFSDELRDGKHKGVELVIDNNGKYKMVVKGKGKDLKKKLDASTMTKYNQSIFKK